MLNLSIKVRLGEKLYSIAETKSLEDKKKKKKMFILSRFIFLKNKKNIFFNLLT